MWNSEEGALCKCLWSPVRYELDDWDFVKSEARRWKTYGGGLADQRVGPSLSRAPESRRMLQLDSCRWSQRSALPRLQRSRLVMSVCSMVVDESQVEEKGLQVGAKTARRKSGLPSHVTSILHVKTLRT